MDNIVLIGFMGGGKTTVGKALSGRTGHLLLDSDREIETKQQKKIADIFKEQGEPAFRKMEADYLEELAADTRKLILSTGGGMPLLEENARRMKKVGTVVYLRAKPETLYERLKDDVQRPLLQTGDKRAIITELLAKRNPLYEKAADVIIDTDDNDLERVVEEIIKLAGIRSA